MVNSTPTGTMMPTVDALSAGTKMNSEHNAEAAEQRGQYLREGRGEHGRVKDGRERRDEDDAEDDDDSGDDAGNGDGDGGDDLPFLGADVRAGLLKRVERDGKLEIRDIARDKAEV